MYAFQYLLVFLNDIIFPITYMLQNLCLGFSLCLVLNVLFNIIFVMYYFFRITKRRADILNWGIFSGKYNIFHKYRLMRHLQNDFTVFKRSILFGRANNHTKRRANIMNQRWAIAFFLLQYVWCSIAVLKCAIADHSLERRVK